MRRVLILGAGFGGVPAALALRQKLAPDDEVVVVERRSHFMLGLRKPWALVGRSTLEAGQRPVADLARQGLRVIRGAVTAIDPAARAAEIDGERIEADALVVALGAELAPEQVPGFREHALNIYDPDSVPRAAEALQRFSGGRLVIGIFGAPYKCPPAPYEIAFLVQEMLQARNIPGSVEVFSPQPLTIPILGQAGCAVVDERLAERGITFLANHKATAVEPGEVVFATSRRPYDLLLGVPPHRCPAVVAQSGLTGDGAWVPVDARTLATRFPGVYALGDVTQIVMGNGMPLPKAGVFAEAEGLVVAEHIAAAFAGRQAEVTFEGLGYCFMETGRGAALLVRGQFLAQPAPQITATEPSPQYLQDKVRFEAERLQAWFGEAGGGSRAAGAG